MNVKRIKYDPMLGVVTVGVKLNQDTESAVEVSLTDVCVDSIKRTYGSGAYIILQDLIYTEAVKAYMMKGGYVDAF